MKVYIDSNIPMYVAGKAHPCRASALRFLSRVRDGELDAYTSTEVLQEILLRYAALGRARLGAQVYDHFVQLCPTVLPVELADTDRGRQLVESNPKASARNALHAAIMLNHGIREIATFDPGFDRLAGIIRFKLK